MSEQRHQFAPDWVSPPGETLKDLLEERGWTQRELATRLGYSEKHISQLINGKVPLSESVAQQLEHVLGAPASFWLNREANYREHKARLENERNCKEWVPWLDELPVRQMMKCGAIPKRRLTKNNKPGVVASCLRFFGVASPTAWHKQYSCLQASFRRSDTQKFDAAAATAWLRLGEIEAEKHALPPYNKARFKAALEKARTLTCQPPQDFRPELESLLKKAGVLLALVPAIPRARVSGVARWLNATQPIIQLSLYGRTNDKFWFNLFHEAAHLLLHAGNHDARQSVYLDYDQTRNHGTAEREADTWAARWLIPEEHENELSGLKSKENVRAFAKRIGIHPGIVVGRLQHEGFIPQSWMNDLITRVDFKE